MGQTGLFTMIRSSFDNYLGRYRYAYANINRLSRSLLSAWHLTERMCAIGEFSYKQVPVIRKILPSPYYDANPHLFSVHEMGYGLMAGIFVEIR